MFCLHERADPSAALSFMEWGWGEPLSSPRGWPREEMKMSARQTFLGVGEELTLQGGHFCLQTAENLTTSLPHLVWISHTRSRRAKGSSVRLTKTSPAALQFHFLEGIQPCVISVLMFLKSPAPDTAPRAKLESPVIGPAGPF